MKVAVVGAGVAGTAAVSQLVSAGVQCEWLSAPGGASEWTSGAADAEYADPSLPLMPELLAFAEQLGLWQLPPEGCHVVTSEGLLRWARGADRSVLNLTPLAGQLVAVLQLPFGRWDARWLARSLNEARWARTTATRFEAVPLQLEAVGLTEGMHCLDYAASVERHFEAWCRAFSGLDARFAALLVEPRLGATTGVLARLSQRVGRAVGEALSTHADLAGYRFEAARDALAQRLGAALVRQRVERIVVARGAIELFGGERQRRVEAVILALGDWLGGGIELDAAFGQPRLGLELEPASALMWMSGERPFPGVAAARGLDLQGFGSATFENLGVCPGPQQLAPCLVAGDLGANRVRTVLAAARSGIAAAKRLLELRV